MEPDQQDYDYVAWDLNDEAAEKDEKRLRCKSAWVSMETLVERWCGKPATLKLPLMIGGYNIAYRMRVEGADDVVVRVPTPAMVMFPEEKTLAEVATMKYVKDKTSIPVPTIYYHGLSDNGIDQFIIIGSLSATLKDPRTEPGEIHRLDPNILEDKLESFYSQMAGYLLQLSQLHFPLIGSLILTGHDSYSVAGRPISVNMNDMIQLAHVPPSILLPKDKTYKTTDEWYVALAEMHMAQLLFQHNDLVSTQDDCRNKYIARRLFWKLAKKGRLSTFGFAEDNWSVQSKTQVLPLSPAPSNSKDFRFWCDDLRAGNVLLKEDRIGSLIDWEFTYVAPTQFSLDPPWWLLLDQPERWLYGMDRWSKVYDRRLKTWLRAMGNVEEREGVNESSKLSKHMRESWETGRFWLNYAAKKSWVFDSIYWKYLDERFFGSREENVDYSERWKARIGMLSQREKSAMEDFVERKMEESKERILVDWQPAEAKSYLAQALFEDNAENLEDGRVT